MSPSKASLTLDHPPTPSHYPSDRYKDERERLEHELAELKSKNEELSNQLTEQTQNSDICLEKEIAQLNER